MSELVISILFGTAGLLAYAVSKFASGSLVSIITALSLIGSLIFLVLHIRRKKGFGSKLKAVFLALLTIIAGTYLILFPLVYFFQDTIANQTSSFFQPKKLSDRSAGSIISDDVEELELTSTDGTKLHGWLIHNSREPKSPLIIYFGGSGSEASEMIPYAQKLIGWSVALINYRGFGLSEGTPNHQNAINDALIIYDAIASRSDVDPSHIFTMGYSLGTGVAVNLSYQRQVAGVILVSPYDRWSLIGLKDTPLFIPLSGIMKPYFDSISLAPMIDAPLLCLIDSDDIVVPPELSIKLIGAWGGEVTEMIYPGDDHSLLFHKNSSWDDILTFLGKLE